MFNSNKIKLLNDKIEKLQNKFDELKAKYDVLHCKFYKYCYPSHVAREKSCSTIGCIRSSEYFYPSKDGVINYVCCAHLLMAIRDKEDFRYEKML